MRVLLVEDDDGDALIVEEELSRLRRAGPARPRTDARRRRSAPGSRATTACCSTSTCPTRRGSTGCASCARWRPGSPCSCSPASTTSAAGWRRSPPARRTTSSRARPPACCSRARSATRSSGGGRSSPSSSSRSRSSRRARTPAWSAACCRRRSSTTRRSRSAPTTARAAAASLLGGDFFDAVQIAVGHDPRGRRRRQRPRPGRGGARRLAADRLAHARARGRDAGRAAPAPPAPARGRAPRAPDLHDAVHGLDRPRRARAASLRLAGHPPPLLLRDGDVEALEPGPPGPPLGVLDDAAWPAYEIALGDAWALLLFTDGLTDGKVGGGPRRLGERGLAEVVAAARAGAADPRDLVRLVVERAEDLNEGPLGDDVAMLLMTRRTPVNVPSAPYRALVRARGRAAARRRGDRDRRGDRRPRHARPAARDAARPDRPRRRRRAAAVGGAGRRGERRARLRARRAGRLPRPYMRGRADRAGIDRRDLEQRATVAELRAATCATTRRSSGARTPGGATMRSRRSPPCAPAATRRPPTLGKQRFDALRVALRAQQHDLDVAAPGGARGAGATPRLRVGGCSSAPAR